MSNLKKLLIFAIIPAFIAGFFSIVPKIYDVLTEPKSELIYSVVDGPGLDVQGNIRKIYSVRIINGGKKTLTDIQAQIRLAKGEIEQFKLLDPSGIKLSSNGTKDALLVNAGTLHSTEYFVISAMLLMPLSDTNVVFTLRSKEVLGKIKSEHEGKKSAKSDLIGAMLASFSVFVMVILVASGRLPLITIILGGKQDILYYIAARLGFTSLTNQLSVFGTGLTYLRMADIFLSSGLSNEKLRPLSIKALKCMLIIKDIFPTSLNVVKKDIQILERENFSEKEVNMLRKESISLSDYMKLRERIDRYLNEKTWGQT